MDPSRGEGDVTSQPDVDAAAAPQPAAASQAAAAPQAPAGAPAVAPPRRRGRWKRRLGVAFVVLVLFALVSHLWWGRNARARLEAQLAAARAAGEPVNVEELNRWPALRREGRGKNVVPLFRDAADLVEQDSDAWREFMAAGNPSPMSDEGAVPLTDKEVAAMTPVVEANAEALRLLEQWPADASVDWKAGYTSPFINYKYPGTDLNGARGVAMVLRADGLLAHRAGDHARALRRAGQCLDVADAVGHHAQLVPHLVAIGVSALGAGLVGETVPEMIVAAGAGGGGGAGASAGTGRVPPEQVRTLIDRLLDDRPLRLGWRRAMVGERVMVVDVIESLLRGDLTFHNVGAPPPAPGEPPRGMPRGLPWLARPFLLDNAAALAEYDAAVLRATENAVDLQTAKAALPHELLEKIRTSKRLLVAGILTPSLERALSVHYRITAEKRLAATGLAISLYAADHGGRMPPTLEALVPKYLPAVPGDPLAAGSPPLRYVNDADDADRPRVYSVGDNGEDNGGADPDPDAPRRVNEATSDLVYHLKRQPRRFPTPLVFEEPDFEAVPEATEGEPGEPGEPPTTGPSPVPSNGPATGQ